MKNKSLGYWAGLAIVISGAFVFWMANGIGQIPSDISSSFLDDPFASNTPPPTVMAPIPDAFGIPVTPVIIELPILEGAIIHYTIGPRGPIRQNKEFYAGETIFILLELPQKFVVHNKFDLYFPKIAGAHSL